MTLTLFVARDDQHQEAASPARTAVDLLVARAQKKDPAALRSLVAQLSPIVLRVARSILGHGHPDVEDVAQVALVDVARSLDAFRHECPVSHYAARIAARRAIEQRKRERQQRGHLTPLSDEAPHVLATEDEPRDPHLLGAWQDLLVELPPEQAEALVLRVVLGHTLEETAEATNAPVNTVRSRLRLAREAILKKVARYPSLLQRLGVRE